MVVCSRKADYLAQTARVQLSTAVMVQPLSQEQVEAYLHNAGPQVGELNVAIHHDSDLQRLSTTPLMLSILSQAYQGTPLHKIAPLGTLPAKRQEVFTTYVQRMLTRRGSSQRYTQQQTIHWLSWLAKQLVQHRQTEFSLEQMQPDWLLDRRVRRLYALVVTLVVGLISGTPFGLAFGPIFVLRVRPLKEGLIDALHLYNPIWTTLWVYYWLDDLLIGGLAIGLIGDFVIKLAAGSKAEIGFKKALSWSWTKMRRGLVIV